MSHIEKQRIFNEYAISKGYEDWQDMVVYFAHHISYSNSADPDYNFLNHFYNICDLIQEEQQKRIAQKLPRDGNSNLHCAGVKDLIINPENKIQ